MDIGATLNFLFTFPVSDESQFLQAKSDFDQHLLKSSENELHQIYKNLRFLTNEDFMARSLIIKYRLFVSKLLSHSIIEGPPKLPPFYFPSQSTNLNLTIPEPDKVLRSKILMFKLAELYFKQKLIPLILELKIAIHRSKHVKKAMKLAKTKIRVREFFKFSVGLFKIHTKKMNRTQGLNDIFMIKTLACHGKVFRRNQKVANIFGIFLEQARRIFWELSIKKTPISVETPRKTTGSVSELMKTPNTPNSFRRSLQGTPYTPKKSPYRDYPNKNFIDLVNKVFLSFLKSHINNLREIIPVFKKSGGLSRIYERMTVYFRKLMFIQFVHHIEKKVKTQKILNILLMAQINKHSLFFKKKVKLEKLSNLFFISGGKIFWARVWSANKFLNNVENKMTKVQKLTNKASLRMYTKRIFKIGKKYLGVKRFENIGKVLVNKNLRVFLRVAKDFNEISGIFEKLYCGKKIVKINSLLAYAKQFREFGTIRNLFDRAADLAIKKNIFQANVDLKKLKDEISLIECKNILTLAVVLGKLQAKTSQIIDENKKHLQTLDKVKLASKIIEKFIKNNLFALLKTVQKYYKYEFTESKNLNTISKFVNKLPVSIKNQKAIVNNTASQGFQTFLQLFSIVNTSFTEQKSQFSEVDQMCSQLTTQLKKTSEILSETSQRTQEIDSEIQKIRENKQKFIQSQNTLYDLQTTLDDLNLQCQRLVKSTYVLGDKERVLDDEISDVLKTYGKIELACKETEHEIKRVEQEYSLIRDKKNRYVNSPERFNRLGASFNSPERRSPYQSPRKFTNGSLNHLRGSPSNSPLRSRREETFPSFRDSFN